MSPVRRASPLLLLAVARLAAAAEPARPFAAPEVADGVPAGSVGSLGEVALALLIVLGAVFAAAWAMRRMRGFGQRAGAHLEVLAAVPVGPKERAVLLRVGTTQLLVGVAQGSVNTLHVLPEPLVPAAPVAAETAATPSFREQLLRSLGKA